jgi:hypothetical protein
MMAHFRDAGLIGRNDKNTNESNILEAEKSCVYGTHESFGT